MEKRKDKLKEKWHNVLIPASKQSLETFSLSVFNFQLKLYNMKNMLQDMVSICQQHKHSELSLYFH